MGRSSGGGGRGGGGGVSSLDKKISNMILEKESSIYRNKRESAYVIDSNGNVIADKVGTKNGVTVYLSNEEMNGSVFTHNHPGGSSFSTNDICVASKGNLKEIRAVGEVDGKRYIYSAKPGRNGWPTRNAIANAYNRYQQEVKNELVNGFRNGTISKSQYYKTDVNHESWLRVAQELRFVYTRNEF